MGTVKQYLNKLANEIRDDKNSQLLEMKNCEELIKGLL